MADFVDLAALRQAIRALSDALDVVEDRTWFDAQPDKVRNTLAAGAVQSIEFVYELSIKSLRRVLAARAASSAEIDQLSYRDLWRTAAEQGLVDVAQVPAWFGYREMRNITAHTYDHAKARTVLAQARPFLESARVLLTRLEIDQH